MRGFASDNSSGVLPEVMEALAAANVDHAVAYGDDPWTAAATGAIRAEFGADADVFFTLTGTGANVVALGTLCRAFEGVLCTSVSHLHVDECGAPEKVAGCKLIPVDRADGKLRPDGVEALVHTIGVEHHIQPRVVSITQCNEYGLVYTLEEIADLANVAHTNGLYVHMDGARFANAVVALNTTAAAMTRDVGVDVISFGGTKNGLMFGEAVVFCTPNLARDAKFVRKQSTQLASKMRFVAAQFSAVLKDGLWLRAAAQANAMAALLAERAAVLDGVEVTRDVQANEVFARLPHDVIAPLQEHAFFYVWDPATDEVRWVTSFDTTEDDVNAFINRMDALLGG